MCYLLCIIVLATIIVIQQFKIKDLKTKVVDNNLQKTKALNYNHEYVNTMIMDDLHDSFGNQLIALYQASGILNDLIDQNKTHTKEFKGFLKNFKKYIMILGSELKILQWSNSMEHNSVFKTLTKIKENTPNLKVCSTINFVFKNELKHDIQLPPYWNRQIVLIINEAVINACIHSKCTTIYIIMSLENNMLKIECNDNGRGFDVNNSLKKGLSISQKRAKTINFDLSINSINGSGTTVILKGKVPC